MKIFSDYNVFKKQQKLFKGTKTQVKEASKIMSFNKATYKPIKQTELKLENNLCLVLFGLIINSRNNLVGNTIIKGILNFIELPCPFWFQFLNIIIPILFNCTNDKYRLQT